MPSAPGTTSAPWSGDREHLYSDPARIHVRQARIPEVSQLVPLDDLSPDDIGPGKAAAADGGGVGAADDCRISVVLFQRNHAHGSLPDLLGLAKHVCGACTNIEQDRFRRNPWHST